MADNDRAAGRRARTDHAADAGGDERVLQAKRELREVVWNAMSEEGVARFPGAHGRIPNFIGAEQAAELLRGTDVWQHATTVKANPDSPQWPVRQRAVEDGMMLYMAVPRLAERNPFFIIPPGELDVTPRQATSIKGAQQHGRTVPVTALEPVDLIVTGCVAVDRSGARLGKGGGYADLEFVLAAAAGLVGARTQVITTVHELQILDEGSIPMTAHDVPVDVVVTPDDVIQVDRQWARPEGVMWEELTGEKIDAIPLLRDLRGR